MMASRSAECEVWGDAWWQVTTNEEAAVVVREELREMAAKLDDVQAQKVRACWYGRLGLGERWGDRGGRGVGAPASQAIDIRGPVLLLWLCRRRRGGTS